MPRQNPHSGCLISGFSAKCMMRAAEHAVACAYTLGATLATEITRAPGKHDVKLRTIALGKSSCAHCLHLQKVYGIWERSKNNYRQRWFLRIPGRKLEYCFPMPHAAAGKVSRTSIYGNITAASVLGLENPIHQYKLHNNYDQPGANRTNIPVPEVGGYRLIRRKKPRPQQKYSTFRTSIHSELREYGDAAGHSLRPRA